MWVVSIRLWLNCKMLANWYCKDTCILSIKQAKHLKGTTVYLSLFSDTIEYHRLGCFYTDIYLALVWSSGSQTILLALLCSAFLLHHNRRHHVARQSKHDRERACFLKIKSFTHPQIDYYIYDRKFSWSSTKTYLQIPLVPQNTWACVIYKEKIYLAHSFRDTSPRKVDIIC